MQRFHDTITPNTIILVLLLNENIDIKDIRLFNQINKYVIERILDKTGFTWAKFTHFIDNLSKYFDNHAFIQLVINKTIGIKSFNDLYKYLLSSLKNLKLMNSKVDDSEKPKVYQGNIIDLFIRKTWLTFNRMTFSDLVKLYKSFSEFCFSSGQQLNDKKLAKYNVHDMVYLKLNSNIENFSYCYNYSTMDKEINKLRTLNNQDRIYYLKYNNESQNNNPFQAIDNLHKYFDQNLRQLFLNEKADTYTNKIAHATLNSTSINLKYGYFDEALRGIEESLRIAQNNADEESINYCLIYLYNIAGVLGLHKDEMMLSEHAISHAMSLNNPFLMLYSSIYYAQFQRIYDCTMKESDILRNRNISWIDGLNFASKKIVSFYESSSLSNKIIDSQNMLFIPIILQKLVKCLNFENLNQTKLLSLHINSIKENYEPYLFANKSVEIMLEIAYIVSQWDPQKSLELFKLYEAKLANKINSRYQFYLLSTLYTLALNRCEYQTVQILETQMFELFEDGIREPSLFSLAWSLKNERLLKQGLFAEAYNSILCLIEYNKKRGYIKNNLIKEYLNIAIIYLKTNDLVKALLQIQKCIMLSKSHVPELYLLSKIYKAIILSKMNNPQKALKILRKIKACDLMNLKTKTLALYHYAKGLVYLSLNVAFGYVSGFTQEILPRVLEILNKSLSLYISIGCLEECREIYYLQARIFNDFDMLKYREVASHYFITSDNLIKSLNCSCAISKFNLPLEKLVGLQDITTKLISSKLIVCKFTF